MREHRFFSRGMRPNAILYRNLHPFRRRRSNRSMRPNAGAPQAPAQPLSLRGPRCSNRKTQTARRRTTRSRYRKCHSVLRVRVDYSAPVGVLNPGWGTLAAIGASMPTIIDGYEIAHPEKILWSCTDLRAPEDESSQVVPPTPGASCTSVVDAGEHFAKGFGCWTFRENNTTRNAQLKRRRILVLVGVGWVGLSVSCSCSRTQVWGWWTKTAWRPAGEGWVDVGFGAVADHPRGVGSQFVFSADGLVGMGVFFRGEFLLR